MLAEGALGSTAIQMHLQFAILWSTYFPGRADTLWYKNKDSMTDDILHRIPTLCNDLAITFYHAMYNEALIAIEELCVVNVNLPDSHFGRRSRNRSAYDLMNPEMYRELQYSTAEMESIIIHDVPLLTHEHDTIYDLIMLAVSAGQSDFFFMHRVKLAKHFSFRSFLPKYDQIVASHWSLHHLALQQLYWMEAKQLI